MNRILFYILIGFAIFTTIKNFKQLKQSKNESDYFKAYKALINNDEMTDEFIEASLNSSDEVSKNKTYILKLYQSLKDEKEYLDVLNKIDTNILYKEKDQVSALKLQENSDSFIWLLMVMAKAHNKNQKDVIIDLYKKFEDGRDNYQTSIEYRTFECAHNILVNEGDYSFLKDLIEGTYENLTYNKNYIGPFERIAELFLAYANEPLDQFYIDDIKDYTKIAVGSLISKDLGIFDKYQEVEIETEPESKEE